MSIELPLVSRAVPIPRTPENLPTRRGDKLSLMPSAITSTFFLIIFALKRSAAISLRLHDNRTSTGALSIGPERCRRKRKHDAAIIYLAAPPEGPDWENLQKSLSKLKRLKDNGRAEVRVFYDREDTWSEEQLQTVLQKAAPRDACVVPIQFRTLPRDLEGTEPKWQKRSPWGYQHMCRFFFADIFQIPDLQKYTYWMRMDTDSYLSTDADIDPFKAMDANRNLVYLHNQDSKDCGDVAEGLHDLVTEYYKKVHSNGQASASVLSANPHAITLDHILPLGKGCVRGYYNNIEIGRLSAFRSAPMIAWRDAVLGSKGIYLHRWGDALLRRLSIELTGAETEPLPKELLQAYRHAR